MSAIQVSDKETRAVFLNFKELRTLEKNIQALDLEQAYSVSLINLDQKIMKIYVKKLRDRVQRIKSNLSNGDIESLKNLEDAGTLDLKPSASKMDFNIRIEGAAKRLKLQARAKSAVPRLENRSSKSNGYSGVRARWSMNEKSPFVTDAGRREAYAMREPCPSERSSRSRRSSVSPCRTASSRVKINVEHAPSVSREFPVPSSVRKFRRDSINIMCMDDLKTSSVNGSTDNLSIGIRSRTSSVSRPMTLDINGRDSPRSRSPSISSPHKPTRKGSTDTKPATPKIAVTPSPQKPMRLNLPDDGGASPVCPSPVDKSSLCRVETLSVPGLGAVPTVNDNKLRPMSVPSQKVSDFGSTDDKDRPKTAKELASIARKKSVADIQRASSLLAEGKTRVPYTCHDLKAMEEKAKIKKPFRSIREGTFSVTNIDNADNSLGDDLHKQMQKGMIMGEVASSLFLEDRIDTYIEKVEQYIKENPNYTYDPEKTRVEIEKRREANREAKMMERKKPKRNVYHRQQLQKRLAENNAFGEAGKARYLRIADEKIDTSGVNTLVIDQMHMLKKMKCWNK